MLDAAGSTSVWDAAPEPLPPDQTGRGGRTRTRWRAGHPNAKRRRLETLVKERFASEAQEITIRQTTQGPLRAKVLILEVWLWEEGSAEAERRTVVARQYEEGKIKISWTNAPGVDLPRFRGQGGRSQRRKTH
ncbi:MAG: hypothetical protein H7A47_03460 [Verrucomicrobiales bacterium]|nr:hypothetical protein [Verrucomicrobiales bacterium]